MAVRYVCTAKCYHNQKLYRIGDYAKFKNAKDGPHDKKGKLINFEIVDDGAEVDAPKLGVKVNNQDV